jgi:hypothetical protein
MPRVESKTSVLSVKSSSGNCTRVTDKRNLSKPVDRESRMSFSELDQSRQSESASESDFKEEQHAFRKGLRLKM